MRPMVATVAELEPEMAANVLHVMMVARAIPPRMGRRMAAARAESLTAIPPAPMRSPVRMKRGMARRA